MRHTLLPIAFVDLALCLGAALVASALLALGWFVADARIGDAQKELDAAQATAEARSTLIADLQAQVATQQRELDDLRSRLTSTPTPGPLSTPSVTPTPPSPRATPTPPPTITPALDVSLMDSIQRQVSALRGLAPRRPVERAIMTAAELREYITRKLNEDYPKEEARSDLITLLAFGLLDSEMDLHGFYVDLYSEQIAGFYDSDAKKLYVISDLAQFGPLERTTFAHEYGHALQDQHFDLEGLGIDDERDSQRAAAIRALAEGDALLIMQQYMQRYFSPQDLAGLLEQLGAADQSTLENAPRVFQEELQFPYVYGLQFVQEFYNEGGWEAVNRVWADPPVSTEQIMHPERYRADDAPQPVTLPPLTDTLGAGWRLMDEDSLGEFLLRVVLEGQIDSEEASAAAEGWGGDRYAVYYQEAQAQTVLALRTVWDTAAEATEFVGAYTRYAQARFSGQAGEQRPGQRCWRGSVSSQCLLFRSNQALVVLGPTMDVINAVLARFPDFR
jgi:hypothetical protein